MEEDLIFFTFLFVLSVLVLAAIRLFSFCLVDTLIVSEGLAVDSA